VRPGGWQPVHRQLAARDFEEGGTLVVGQLQQRRQPFGDGQGGATFIRLDFAQGDERTADLLRELLAAQEQSAAAAFEPLAKGGAVVHRANSFPLPPPDGCAPRVTAEPAPG
jgi:hypothetical protein